MNSKFKLYFIGIVFFFIFPLIAYAQSAKSNCVITKVGNTGAQKPIIPLGCQPSDVGKGGIPNSDHAALLAKVKQYADEGKITFDAPNDNEGMTNGTGEILRMDGSVVPVDTQVLRSFVYLVDQGFTFGVSCLVCQHKKFSSTGNVSRHWDGYAADIWMINGFEVNDPIAKDATVKYMKALNVLEGGDLAPSQVLCSGNGRVDPDVDALSMTGGKVSPGFSSSIPSIRDSHMDHVHVGY